MDESCFWLHVISDLELVRKTKLTLLMKEGEESCKIFAKSIITSKTKTAP